MSICLTDDQISILIILVLGLYDCTERKAINNPITTIKVCPNDKALLTSEFTNEMEIISLDENEECYIARINKLMVYNDTIIIVDRVLSKAIYFFNQKGEYITKICQVGKGPGEYSSIQDVAIHKGQILVYDGSRKKLLHFNLNGEFIKEETIGLLVNEIGSNHDLIVFNCWQFNTLEDGSHFRPGLIGYNEDSGLFFQIMEFCDEFLKIPITYGFYNLHDSLFLCSPISDTIYSITNVSTPVFFIDFNKFSTPDSYKDLIPNNNFANDIINMKHVTGKVSFLYSNNVLSLAYTVGLKKYYFIRNRDSFFEGNCIFNDLLPVGLSDPMFLDNDFLYFLTINSEIDNLRKLEDSQIIQELQKRLSNNIQQFKNSQNDNPYIVKVKIKRSKG